MTRKEVKVSVKMRTNGGIYVCPNIMGDIIVYEDQVVAINNKIAKCRTREEAKEIIHDFGCGLDLHHSDVQTPTIRKKNMRQSNRGIPVQRKPVPGAYTPPVSSTNQNRNPQVTTTRSRKTNVSSVPPKTPSMDSQVRISTLTVDSGGVHELE